MKHFKNIKTKRTQKYKKGRSSQRRRRQLQRSKSRSRKVVMSGG